MQFLAKFNITCVPHPPYSPDLAPCDFFLFPSLEAKLRGIRFETSSCSWATELTALSSHAIWGLFDPLSANSMFVSKVKFLICRSTDLDSHLSVKELLSHEAIVFKINFPESSLWPPPLRAWTNSRKEQLCVYLFKFKIRPMSLFALKESESGRVLVPSHPGVNYFGFLLRTQSLRNNCDDVSWIWEKWKLLKGDIYV